MISKKKTNNRHGLMTLAGGTASMAKSLIVLDKTESALEKELEKEAQRQTPTTKIEKVRHKGKTLLHTKYILLMVVLLNLLDCLLVLAELMLDIKYVTDLLKTELDRSEHLIGSMKGLYPVRLGYLKPDDIENLEHELLMASISWDQNIAHSESNTDAPSEHNNTIDPYSGNHFRRKRYDRNESEENNIGDAHGTAGIGNSGGFHQNDSEHDTIKLGTAHAEHAHNIEEEIAHGLHKASISILGILVVETFVKMFCFGKEMLEHRLECFDSVIVTASFIVDLVFLKGLQQFTVQEFVLILAFMVPWRIIRVVNSLVVAIMDHGHLRLKLLYKHKKKVSKELKEAKEENKGLEACIDALEKLCNESGVPATHVKAKLKLYRKVKAKTSAMDSLGNFAIGGKALDKPFMNGLNDRLAISDVSITMDEDKKEAVEKDSETKVTSPSCNMITNLTAMTVDIGASTSSLASDDSQSKPINKSLQIDRRPSRSALDARETESHPVDKQFLTKLAKNSAGFIATISKDDEDIKQEVKQGKPHETNPTWDEMTADN